MPFRTMLISRCFQLVTSLVVGMLAIEILLVMAFDRVFHPSEREREKLYG
jgi:hypothetical protein